MAHQMCLDAMKPLQERIIVLQTALKPFAAIKPSSFNAEDGSENEGYTVILSRNLGPEKLDFTGADLARARAALRQGNEQP